MTIVHLTSRIALRDFTYSWAHHPFQMARAAWSGFVGERDEAIARIAATTVPRHVLWAERDTLLPRTDGRRFARALHASFTIGHSDGSRTIDHDWMYREPKVFAEHLFDLRLHALHTGGAR
jgi:pimeloyl-ACP methyl ester carboxylesterase